jgi:hypothetical protein
LFVLVVALMAYAVIASKADGFAEADGAPFSCDQMVSAGITLPLPPGETPLGAAAPVDVGASTDATVVRQAPVDDRPVLRPAPEGTPSRTNRESAIAAATSELYKQAKADAQLVYVTTPGDTFSVDGSNELRSLSDELAWVVTYQFNEPQVFPGGRPMGDEHPTCYSSGAVLVVRDSTGEGLLTLLTR